MTMIVAELSANHLGQLGRAKRLIEEAAKAGAHAVKFQTYDPRRLVARSLTLKDGQWAGRDLLELYEECQTPRAWHKPMFDLARQHNLIPFSSAFSREDVDFLESIDCPMYKIASFECVDLDLIRHAASTKKPVIISTGMASIKEVKLALATAVGAKASATLLKCTSDYPAVEANVLGMKTLQEVAYVHGPAQVGLSDHTLGYWAACAATALGATMIEKHLTLDRRDGGPDAAFSAEPAELAELVRAVASVGASLGRPELGISAPEGPQAELRRSLWIVADVARGDVLTRDNLRSCRPSTGIPAGDLAVWLGRRAAREMKSGTPFGGAPDVMAS